MGPPTPRTKHRPRRPPRRERTRGSTRWVAITVALLATFMGICKVKDDNIVQAMQQAQADKIDHWSFYQARNIRQEIAPVDARAADDHAPDRCAGATPAVDSAIARYRRS